MPESIAIICASSYCAIDTLDALTDEQKLQVAGFFIRPNDEFREAAIYAKTQGIHVYGYGTEEDSQNSEDGTARTKSVLTAIRASCILGVGISEAALRKTAPNNAKLYLITTPELANNETEKAARSFFVSTWRLDAKGKESIAQNAVRIAKGDTQDAAIEHIRNAVREQMSHLMTEVESPAAEPIPNPEPAKTENNHKRRHGWVATLFLVLLILVGAGAFAWANIFGNSATSTYYAPDLRGMTVEEATNYIRDTAEYRSHFVISVSEDTISSSVYSDGTIAAQTPTAGSSTKQDMTQITVTLCSEDESVKLVYMPDLSGMDYEEAAQLLSDEYGVTASYTMESSEQYEKGIVISTSPVAGSELAEGQTVRIYVSNGVVTTSNHVTMISIVGMTQEDAEAALTDIGLAVGTVTEVTSDEDAGTVVSQSIDEGEQVDADTKISFEVSKGTGSEGGGEENEEQTNSDDPSSLGNGEHYININMPSGRTEESYLVLTINGSELYSAYIGTDKTSVRLTVEGTIITISITLDGESYTDYTIS